MRAVLPPLLGLAAVLAPGAVDAGGSGSSGCNCTPPPSCSGCAASASAGHTVTVPGVTVIPPSVYIAPSRLLGGVGGTSAASASAGAEAGVAGDISVSLQASASGSASSSTSASLLASAASNATASAQSSGLATANSQAANLLAASGGSASFSEGGGVSGGSISNLVVAVPGGAPAAPRQVCARTAVVAQAVAIQAVCLDDNDVPHPASQVMPGQDVPEGYAGELFRCIAGAHMQYVTAPYAGEARFDHGQTVACSKGEALWRDAGGRLQCRPQTPARDCNERSLLRRYGAGIKVLKAAMAGQCVEWRTEAAGSETVSNGSLQLDGGVGG